MMSPIVAFLWDGKQRNWQGLYHYDLEEILIDLIWTHSTGEEIRAVHGMALGKMVQKLRDEGKLIITLQELM